MIEGLVFGAVALVFAAAIGLIGAAIAFLFWLVVLPFKLLAWSFKGIGLLLALPFLFVFGVFSVVLGGVGFLLFLIPAVPLLLFALLLWWLIKGTAHAVAGS